MSTWEIVSLRHHTGRNLGIARLRLSPAQSLTDLCIDAGIGAKTQGELRIDLTPFAINHRHSGNAPGTHLAVLLSLLPRCYHLHSCLTMAAISAPRMAARVSIRAGSASNSTTKCFGPTIGWQARTPCRQAVKRQVAAAKTVVQDRVSDLQMAVLGEELSRRYWPAWRRPRRQIHAEAVASCG